MESHGCQGKPGRAREGQGRPGRPGKAREARESQGRPGKPAKAREAREGQGRWGPYKDLEGLIIHLISL